MLKRRMIAALVVVTGLALGSSAIGLAAPKNASEGIGGQQFDIPDPATGGRGGEIYLKTCAGCHDEGVGRAPQRRMFTYMSSQSIYHALTDGAMKPMAASLTQEDRVAVAEFLSRQKMGDASQSAEPPMCEAKAVAFNYGEPPVLAGWGLQRTNTRFVPTAVAGISKANVAKLHVKWAVAFPNAMNVRSQPAFAGGAIYVGSYNGGVYALDRETGCARWIYHAGAEVRTGVTVSPWKAGDRTAKPLVYFGDFVGNAYALDAITGKQVWRVRADPHPNATLTGAPTLYGDKLYVPVSSMEALNTGNPDFACCHFRGSILALDARTGAKKWQTYSTDEPKLLGKNAAGADHYGPAGISIWSSPAIDAKRHVLYAGTGANSTSPSTDMSDAIVAMDLDSGAVKWAYQGVKDDASNLGCLSPNKANCPAENGPDYDFGAGAMLVTVNGRDIVLAGQKSGHLHAIDPDSGKLIWKERPGRGGIIGGIHFGMAANADTVFAPVNDALPIMHDGSLYKEPARPGVYAYDIASGKKIWSAPADPDACAGMKLCGIGYSQAITATLDLVVTGNVDGKLRIFDTKTGKLLWRYDTRQRQKTVNGGESTGGSFGGGGGPVLYRGMLVVSSGYALAGSMPGNLLIAFEAK